ncbi:MAG: T9SS type A sorting domain-containing protein [Candidatus Kapabacteria bacterium]|nr:T9SS type A sorting domain-containing protein [Candidatus Kapabacteria bacterium]
MKRNILLLSAFLIELLLLVQKTPAKDNPVTLGENDIYGSFYFCLLPGITAPEDSVAELSISTMIPSRISISRSGELIRNSFFTNANEIQKIKFTAAEVQPTTKYQYRLGADLPYEKVYENSAVHVITHGVYNSISCIVSTKYGDNSDAMTLISAESSGKVFQISHNTKYKQNDSIPACYVAIIGIYDNTSVHFTMGGSESSYVNLEYGFKLEPGQVENRLINSGDVWLIPASGINARLSGSKVNANKPVCVFSGNNSASVTGSAKTNYTILQETPENNWGIHYLIPQLLVRTLYPIVQGFTKVGENTIKLNGTSQWYIHKPGGISGLGYFEAPTGTKPDDGNYPFPQVLSSDIPFNIVMVNPGKTVNDNFAKPFQMQILPTHQFRNSGIFNITDPNQDCITLVYRATKEGQIPDDMYITEVVGGKFEWVKLNEYSLEAGSKFFGIYEDSTQFRSKNLEFSKAGLFAVKSEFPLAIYQYQHPDGDKNSAFGYHIGSEIYEPEIPDTLAPTIEFTGCCCNIDGIVYDEPRSDSNNRSNLGLVYMEHSDSYNFKFIGEGLVPGISPVANWSLIKMNDNLDARAHLIFMDRVGNRLDTVFECPVKIPVITPGKAVFGDFEVENPVITKTITFNIRGQNNLEIPENYEMYIILDSDSTDEKANDINTYQNFDLGYMRDINVFPISIGGSKTFQIKFTAKEKGVFKDSVGVVILTRNTQNNSIHIHSIKYLAELYAFVGDNSIKAGDYSFGSIEINYPVSIDINIENPSNGSPETTIPLTITGFSFTGDDIGIDGSGKVFEVSGLENISVQNPVVIEPDNNLTLSIKFEPKEVKEYSAEITFIADAELPDNKTILTGRGEPSTSVEENIIGSNIEIRYDNGFLKFFSNADYQIDEIEIYDLSGKLILSEKINQTLNGYSLRTNNFTSGVYIVKMYINGIWFSKKVII